MTDDREYNDWTNYETWAVNLWMTNDQESDNHVRDLADECYAAATGEHPSIREDRARFKLADKIKAEWLVAMPDLGASCWTDLLTLVLDRVNWQEIASHYIEQVAEAAAAEGGAE